MIGRSGTGKTEAILSLLKELSPLRITNKEGLKDLTDNHGVLVMDDIDLRGIARQEYIHLFDSMVEEEVRVLFGVKKIKKGLPRVFISNIIPSLFLQDEAIQRRVLGVLIEEPMFTKNPKIELVVKMTEILKENDVKKLSSGKSCLITD